MAIFISVKKILLARISGIQVTLSRAPHAGLIKLDGKLLDDLDKVLEQEEMLWFQIIILRKKKG